MSKFRPYLKEKHLDLITIVLNMTVMILLLLTLSATRKSIQQGIESNKLSSRYLKQSARDTKYMYLTGIWNDIMKESIQHPEFNNEKKTSVYRKAFKGDKQRQYDKYARWIGGFIEDLYINNYQEEKFQYYDPTIKTFMDMHETWLVDHIRYYKHTPKFYERLLDLKNKKPTDQ